METETDRLLIPPGYVSTPARTLGQTAAAGAGAHRPLTAGTGCFYRSARTATSGPARIRQPIVSNHVRGAAIGGSVPCSRHAELNGSRASFAYRAASPGKWCRKFIRTYASAFATCVGERRMRAW